MEADDAEQPAVAIDTDLGRIVMAQLMAPGIGATLRQARLVSRAYLRSADDVLVERAGALLASMFDVPDPVAAARRMCRDAQNRDPGHFDAPVPELGPPRVERFLRAIQTCCRAGATIAGSAALYVECVVEATEPLGWFPNDIDAWVDHPTDGARVLDALVPIGAPVRAMHRTEGAQPWRGYWPSRRSGLAGDWQPAWRRLERAPAVYPGASMVCTVVLDDQQRVQVITQRVVEAGGYAEPTPECRCTGPLAACAGCLKQRRAPVDDTGPLTAQPTGPQDRARAYFDVWPKGRPEQRFDLDVVACAIRADERGFLQLHRAIGDPRSSTVCVRPHALWRFDGDDVVPIDREGLDAVLRRLRKYAARGWTNVVVPRETIVGGRTMTTPDEVLAEIARALEGEGVE